MTLADALQHAVDRPATDTMGALFDALVAASDEEYLTFWDLLGAAGLSARMVRSMEQARVNTDKARSLVRRYGASLSR